MNLTPGPLAVRTTCPYCGVGCGVLATPQAYAEEAQHYQSLNYAAYKIHPPQSWRQDITVCETVRKAVGDDYLLMLDSAWSYDYAAALRVGHAIGAGGQETVGHGKAQPLGPAAVFPRLSSRSRPLTALHPSC